MAQRFLVKIDDILSESARHQRFLHMRKEAVVAEVALQVAGVFVVDGIDLGHVESQVVKVAAEMEKSLVFLDVVAVSAYETARFGKNPIVVS